MSYPLASDLITPTGFGTADVILPVGFAASHRSTDRNRTASVSEMTGHMEETIFDLRKGGKKALAGIVTALLRVGVNSVGDWERKKPDELAPEGLIKGMFQMDREALFLSIMIATYPDDHVMELQCPECAEKMHVPVDLQQTEVRSWPEDAPAWVDITLPQPLRVPGIPTGPDDKTEHEALRARFYFPTGFDSEMGLIAHGDNAPRVASFIYSRRLRPIAEGSNEELSLPMDIAQRLPTRVRKGISNAIRENYPGPILEARVTCPECGQDVAAGLNLTDFFSGE